MTQTTRHRKCSNHVGVLKSCMLIWNRYEIMKMYMFRVCRCPLLMWMGAVSGQHVHVFHNILNFATFVTFF